MYAYRYLGTLIFKWSFDQLSSQCLRHKRAKKETPKATMHGFAVGTCIGCPVTRPLTTLPFYCATPRPMQNVCLFTRPSVRLSHAGILSGMQLWEIDRWMLLNADKTQFIWLGTRQRLTNVQCHTVDLGNVSLPVATKVTCWGVIFDSELTFSEHVTSVVRRCFYHMRQLRTVRKSLTTESVKTLVRRSLQALA